MLLRFLQWRSRLFTHSFQMRCFARGTFPGIVSEQWVDFRLQQAFPLETARFVAFTLWTLHADSFPRAIFPLKNQDSFADHFLRESLLQPVDRIESALASIRSVGIQIHARFEHPIRAKSFAQEHPLQRTVAKDNSDKREDYGLGIRAAQVSILRPRFKIPGDNFHQFAQVQADRAARTRRSAQVRCIAKA